MSKRLQILLSDAELRDLRAAARRQGVPVSDWVRRALREEHRREPRGDLDGKLRAIRSAVDHEFPSGDIDEMLADIERGYVAPPPR